MRLWAEGKVISALPLVLEIIQSEPVHMWVGGLAFVMIHYGDLVPDISFFAEGLACFGQVQVCAIVQLNLVATADALNLGYE